MRGCKMSVYGSPKKKKIKTFIFTLFCEIHKNNCPRCNHIPVNLKKRLTMNMYDKKLHLEKCSIANFCSTNVSSTIGC